MVTIVILIILAVISINVALGENGLIRRAESTKSIQKMGEEKERLEIVKTDVAVDEKGKVSLDKYIEKLIEKGITTESDVETNEDGSKQVITDNGYSVNIKQDGEYNVIIEIEGTSGELPVKIVDVKLITSTNSIKVELEVERGGNATYKYYYKEKGTDEYGKAVYEGKQTSYTIENLSQDETYVIKVEAINKNGTVSVEKEAVTGDLGTAEGIIEFGDLEWNNGQAEVTVTKNTEDNLRIQYRVLDSELNVIKDYTEIASGNKVAGLKLGETVEVRLWDGTNGSNTASLTVEDETKPIVTVSEQSKTTNSITVNVLATDAESGIENGTIYSYYIKESDETSYPTTAIETTTTSYKFINLDQSINYDIKVKVKDIAGNEGEGELKEISTNTVTAGNSAISFGDLNWSNGKASVIVTKNSDVSSELYIEYSKNGEEYTPIASGATISELILKDEIEARLTDGKNYGSTTNLTIEDKTVPNEAKIDLSATEAKISTNITATVEQNDSQSEIDITKCKWVYNTNGDKIGIDESSYTNTFSTTPQQLTLNITTSGIYYLHVLSVDKAGNKVETISSAIMIYGEEHVARIGTTYYTSIQSAVADVPTNNTQTEIVVLKDVSENISIEENKNVILNLGTYTLSNKTDDILINSDGTLKISSGKVTSNAGADYPTIASREKLTITGGTITSANSVAVLNESGTTEISGGTIEATNYLAVCSDSGNLSITGGKITSDFITVGISTGTASISGGEIYSSSSQAIINMASLDISGTTKIYTDDSITIVNDVGANLKITGGTITSNAHALYNNGGTAEISGTVKISAGNVLYSAVNNQEEGTLTIKGGIITSTSVAVNNTGGTINISGGEIYSSDRHAIVNNSIMNISGTAEISSGKFDYPTVYNRNGGTLEITGGTITSTVATVGIRNESGTVNISGGEIYVSAGNTIVNQSTMNISGIAKISSGDGEYPTIHNIGGTLTITGGTITSTGIGIFNESGTANISGGEIYSSGNNAIDNYAKVNISGTAKISSDSSKHPAVYNQSGGTLTVKGGTISNTAGNYSVYNEGTASVSGATITGPKYGC